MWQNGTLRPASGKSLAKAKNFNHYSGMPYLGEGLRGAKWDTNRLSKNKSITETETKHVPSENRKNFHERPFLWNPSPQLRVP